MVSIGFGGISGSIGGLEQGVKCPVGNICVLSLDAKQGPDALRTPAIEEGNRSSGTVEYELLERWLAHRPTPQLMTAWQTCLKGLCESLSAEDRVLLKQELLHATKTTAEAAGGFLGLGRVSSAEQKILDTLSSSFCQ